MKVEKGTSHLNDARYAILEKLFQTICRIPGVSLGIHIDDETSYPVEADDEENIGWMFESKDYVTFSIRVHKKHDK